MGFEPGDWQGFAGICVDLSHLQDLYLLRPERAEAFERLAGGSRGRAHHMSAVPCFRAAPPEGGLYSSHVAVSSKDFDYLQGLAPLFISDLCAIELENPLIEQLQFVKGIAARLDRKTTALQAA